VDGMAASLALLLRAEHAAAVIGARGLTVKQMKAETGVHSIHVSSNVPGAIDRTAVLCGPMEPVLAAFDKIAAIVRSEDGSHGSSKVGQPTVGRSVRATMGNEVSTIRLLVPDGSSIVGPMALRSVQATSGASVTSDAAPVHDGKKQRLLTLAGSPTQIRSAVALVLELVASRHAARHRDFFAQWSFETNYNDHFETPQQAYADIMPILECRSLEALGTAPGTVSTRCGTTSGSDALRSLRIWDPYYCQGAVRKALVALGCAPEHVINENRDFYADVEAGALPAHDVLVTNPPYSGEHKQRLLAFLLAQAQAAASADRPPATSGPSDEPPARHGGRHVARWCPFLLLLPAWMAVNEYWSGFLERLAIVWGREQWRAARARCQKRPRRARRLLERRAGVFYVCPTARYEFSHPESTGKARAPFHSVWFCGGFATESARRRAVRALRPARRSGSLEVFRSTAMLRKRGALEEERVVGSIQIG
jgi:hypothetical protein